MTSSYCGILTTWNPNQDAFQHFARDAKILHAQIDFGEEEKYGEVNLKSIDVSWVGDIGIDEPKKVNYKEYKYNNTILTKINREDLFDLVRVPKNDPYQFVSNIGKMNLTCVLFFAGQTLQFPVKFHGFVGPETKVLCVKWVVPYVDNKWKVVGPDELYTKNKLNSYNNCRNLDI